MARPASSTPARGEPLSVPAPSSGWLLPAWAAPLQQPPPPAALEPGLARALAQARPDDVLSVIVALRQQVTPEQIVQAAAGPLQARTRLVTALQSLASRSQGSLRAYLDQERASGKVRYYTPFWIFNGLAVRAQPAVVRALAARPEVAVVRLDHYRQWVSTPPAAYRQWPPAPRSPNTAQAIGSTQYAVEWNISRIRAPQVWSSLNISGTGAVVAGMDTGVDWLHPALQVNYRGYSPHGSHQHVGNWFDVVNGSLYPVDDHGHGTHTLGSAVGRNGIGVAPGAQWIAVKVLNSAGYGYDSWIHAGFQWLLAPGGDPTKAPDVVNCSWGSEDGYLTTFQTDLQALRAAGILPVFANGNDGPGQGTVGSPASLPEAFAVGATDLYDQVATFSSRGPSPWGEVRPHVAAPGVQVRSSLPGGLYGSWSGTSMAAPHVSGLVALLRSVSPTLSITHTVFLITSTAVPLSTTLPNNDTGWGLVDAFAAVLSLAQAGIVSGTVRQAGDGTPLPGATVVAVPHGGGGGATALSDAAGHYLLALAPTTYDLSATAFAYQPTTAWGVVVTTGTTTVLDFSLVPLPTGTLAGQVTDAASGGPVSATVAVLDTPLKDSAPAFTFTLPAGTHVLQARALGYRVVTATAVVTAGLLTTVNLAMPPAPSILLVDSGAWYYESQIGYFRQALDERAYAYDEWSIRRLPDEVPAVGHLAPYDVVVWSAPWDAPGYIGAQDAITGYLSAGGRLLLSGQDVGFLDGGGMGYAPYYRQYLRASFVADSSSVWALSGTAGDLFAGMAITIAGAGGADNQDYPDVVKVADPDAAAPVLFYQGDGCAGMRVGTCLDYRVVYLAFGLEGINDRTARREVLGRALDWLVAEPPAVGLELTPASHAGIGLPGTAVTYTLRVRHLGQGGSTDQVSLWLSRGTWGAALSQTSLSLAPCTSATLVVSVTVPPTATWDAMDVLTVLARSTLSPALTVSSVLTTKVPAPILLVDDDRWYEQRDKYEAAMEGAGLPYDLWQVAPALGGGGDESPPLERLRWYPIVVWWTGYDWYAPVTAVEEEALTAYLGGGGRLFLSSQDFLYYHFRDGSPLLPHLGVLTYTEDATPTQATGVPESPISEGLGPYLLDYPFRNWSDSVVPTPGTAVVFRDQHRRGIGLARAQAGHKAVFLSFPFEALPAQERPGTMERIVGWLSWLGGSTFSADRGAVVSGDVLTYTLWVPNDGPITVTASLSNTLPVSLALDPASLVGPATYDPSTRRIGWQGVLGPGAALAVSYRVTVADGLPPGTAITNSVRLGLEEQGVYFTRPEVVRVGAADLSPSALECQPSPARPGTRVICSLALVSAGPADAPTTTAIDLLPTEATFVADSLSWNGGGTAEVAPGSVVWTGPLSAAARVTVTYGLTLPAYPLHPPLYNVAFLDDGAGGAWERAAWMTIEPLRWYFPLVFRNGR